MTSFTKYNILFCFRFYPSVFLYLLVVVPCIWVLEWQIYFQRKDYMAKNNYTIEKCDRFEEEIYSRKVSLWIPLVNETVRIHNFVCLFDFCFVFVLFFVSLFFVLFCFLLFCFVCLFVRLFVCLFLGL